MQEKLLKNIAIIMVLVLISVVSVLFVAERASSTQNNMATINSLDQKSETVLKLTGAATLASIAISAIPDDTATPIAEKLTDFVEYFLLILCVIYAEKYMLTLLGAAAFKYLIPIACAVGIVSLFWKPHITRRLAVKLAVFAVAIFVAIPISINVSDRIYETYEGSINETISQAENFTEETAPLAEASSKNVLTAVLNSLSQTISGITEKASGILNRYMEALAVMIVTSCVMPILVLVFFVWLVKMLTGVDLADRMPAGPWRRPFREKQTPGERPSAAENQLPEKTPDGK